MVSRAKIKELMNESACSHSKDKKPGEGCDKPKPGLADLSTIFHTQDTTSLSGSFHS